MRIGEHLAKHTREFFNEKNWTASSLKQHVANLDWQLATRRYQNLHSIAELVYHIVYYPRAALRRLNGGELDANDDVSFDVPEIKSQEDWESFLNEVFDVGESFAAAVEQLPDGEFDNFFADPKYGTTYRNLQGIVEHAHYHLGQIVMLKRLLTDGEH